MAKTTTQNQDAPLLASVGNDDSASLRERSLAALRDATVWSYRPGWPSAAEPAAWTALALALQGDGAGAERSAKWLATLQRPDGSVGVDAQQESPKWFTSLAILAWLALDAANSTSNYSEAISKATTWAKSERGKPAPRDAIIGHDTTLVGWSWAAATHSWLEPTCLFVMALRAAGEATHPRVVEGERLIADRLLPHGGANFGNTTVLGQELLAHVEPSGLAMLALAGCEITDDRIGRSLDYLERQLARPLSAGSLAYCLLGLTAWDRRPTTVRELLEAAVKRQTKTAAGGIAVQALALAALADDVAGPRLVDLIRRRRQSAAETAETKELAP